tara:strand:+ start:342 stop:1850 length:1509 start_codon:yes stop_codon:yes gene_type:complete
MKQLKKIVLILISVSFFNCSDFIENEITGRQTLDNYYSNLSEVDKAVMGCYASLSPQDWWQNDFFWLVGDICSDDAFKGSTNQGDQRDFGNLADFNITSANEWLDVKWRYTYQGIFRCNLLLKNIVDAPIDVTQKNIFIAEAKFLRGIYYFELVKNFGGVPLLTEPLAINEANESRASETEIWTQIEKDFTEASTDLPKKSELLAKTIGRATQGAALAYLAKSSLYQNKFTEAQNYANQVINSSEYNLSDGFENVWSINNPNGNGSIFEIQQSYNDIYDSGSSLPVVTRSRSDGGWGFCTPSSNLDNFMGNDPRRVHTIIRQGDFVDTDHPSYDTNPSENMTGRINRKYYLSIPNRAPNEEHKRSGLNHILFRYADLLLIHAEAAYKNGDESSAISSLNKIRARVNLGVITTSGTQLLDDIYKERRLELAMEGHRYYDLKRTGRLSSAMSDFLDYNLNRSTDTYDSGNDEGKFFDITKHILFPIPQTEIDLSGGSILQNSGY